MKVTLFNYATPLEQYVDNHISFDYEHLTGIAAAICVNKFEWVTDDYSKNKQSAINSGHDSVLEHLPLTWVIENVSRALTHQLVRHRIASYSQLSQRYTKVQTDEEWYVIPMSINKHAFSSRYLNLMEDIAKLYNDMCNGGVPNEDARMVLPNACFTSIMVSMNARSLVEQCSKRLCKRAQWEIRELYTQMVESIKNIYPSVYNKCVPPCKTSTGCKEKHPCNKS